MYILNELENKVSISCQKIIPFILIICMIVIRFYIFLLINNNNSTRRPLTIYKHILR